MADVIDPLLRFLCVARELCGGDSDQVLVMLVLMLRAGRHPEFCKLKPEDILLGRVALLPTLGVNVRSLSDSTHIARETVRRKVQILTARGWIQRVDGRLHYTPAAYAALAPAYEALIQAAARISSTVVALADDSAAQARASALSDGRRPASVAVR